MKWKYLTYLSPSLSSLSPTSTQPIICRAFPAGGPSRDWTATWPHSSFLFSTPPPMALACRYRLWCSRTKPKVMLGTGEKVSTERLWVKIRFWGVSGTEPWREAETGCLGRRHQSQVKATRTAGLKQWMRQRQEQAGRRNMVKVGQLNSCRCLWGDSALLLKGAT